MLWGNWELIVNQHPPVLRNELCPQELVVEDIFPRDLFTSRIVTLRDIELIYPEVDTAGLIDAVKYISQYAASHNITISEAAYACAREAEADLPSRKSRLLHITGDIDDSLANKAAADLLYLNAENNLKPIFLLINTRGGSIASGFAIYDTIQYIDAPVWTIGAPVAAGMGAFLLASGAYGKRIVVSGSVIGLTQVKAPVIADKALSEIQAEATEKLKQLLISGFCINTGRSTLEISRDIESERTFSDAEAVQYGLADQVVDYETLGSLCQEYA